MFARNATIRGPSPALFTRPSIPSLSRKYHYTRDQVYGFREPVVRSIPDYTPEQLANRANASNLLRFVSYYRSLGHRLASLDPLSLTPSDPSAIYQLDPSRYGLSGDMTFDVNGIVNTGTEGKNVMTLNQIVERLNRTYAGSVGFEFAHLPVGFCRIFGGVWRLSWAFFGTRSPTQHLFEAFPNLSLRLERE
ncbi:hypothetical protein HDU99_005517 [Rhizoclosmatium hyalinum]|nr:hypothetical protein HDU99_005517 [Rhizoclosmatium hyalinum]